MDTRNTRGVPSVLPVFGGWGKGLCYGLWVMGYGLWDIYPHLLVEIQRRRSLTVVLSR